MFTELARRLGQPISVRRSRRLAESGSALYRTVQNCQIPMLGFLIELAVGHTRSGVFVDVGANDGVAHSNTFGLASIGWSGLCIEPVPVAARKCGIAHKNHDVKVLEVAIAGPSQRYMDLILANELSTGVEQVARLYQQLAWARPHMTREALRVQTMTLDDALTSAGIATEIDVLSVDVEGAEASVFEGFSIKSYSPKLIIVELVDTHPDFRGVCEQQSSLRSHIEGSGYTVMFKDYVNTVFIRSDRLSLSSVQG